MKFEVRFGDGEWFADADTLEEAEEIRNKHKFDYFSRSLHIYKVSR